MVALKKYDMLITLFSDSKMTRKPPITNRAMVLPLFALWVAAAVVSGCGTSDKGAAASSGASSSGSDAHNVTFAPTGVGTITGEISEAAFKGGYGIDFYEAAAKEFDAKHGTHTTVAGDPQIWKQLLPQLNGGDPPDLMFPGWGMDHWLLADENQLFVLDKALDSPAAEGTGSWRDSFEPALLKMGQKDGKQFVLPYYFNVQGWWYDPGVFAKNGWTPPQTFDDLLKLSDKIKAKGMAPVTFQGKYPYYMIEGMLLPWTASIGGIEAVNAAQNLEVGAWKSPAILQAAKMIKQLNDAGDLQKGAVGMSHTESQTEFVLGHAAMIPCGTWLYSEMKKTMPPESKMQFMMTPVVAGGKGDPTALDISIEPWMIPSAGKNPNGAVALFKYMTSLSKAKQFVEQKGTLMAIKGSDQAKIPETLIGAAKAFKGSKTVWSYLARQWYPKMETEIENALTSMLNNEITPEQFCDRAEAAAGKTRDDSTVSKHKV
jgi:N-acetylglucosamine transport system substrate-binding protein